MFNIGGGEMMLLAILALLVFGPEGLPEIVKTVTRTVQAFRQAANDFQSEVSTALTVENQKRDVEKRRRRRSPTDPALTASAEAAPLPVVPALAENAPGETSDNVPQAGDSVGEPTAVLPEVQPDQAIIETAKVQERVATAPAPESVINPSPPDISPTEPSGESVASLDAKEASPTAQVEAAAPAIEEDDDGPGLPMVKKPPLVQSDSEPSASLEPVS